MFKDRLRAMLGGGSSVLSAPGGPVERVEPVPRMPPATRHSPGLEQFVAALRGREGLAILDLAGASQANVSFITGLGCRIYSDDFLQSLDLMLAQGENDAAAARRFLDHILPSCRGGFDGALLWDSLQFLPRAWLGQAMERLLALLHPEAVVLALFSAEESAAQIPCFQYRIVDEGTLQLAPRPRRREAQFFKNREIENLFRDFASTKFFLTRDHLREILIRR